MRAIKAKVESVIAVVRFREAVSRSVFVNDVLVFVLAVGIAVSSKTVVSGMVGAG